MKRKNPEILNTIIETIEKGFGRVAACKSAGIHFGTFLHWIDPEHPNYIYEFCERLKEAEALGRQTLKETLENVILKAATDKDRPAWQAAAWRLERSFPKEYAQQAKFDHTSGGEKINFAPIKFVDEKND